VVLLDLSLPDATGLEGVEILHQEVPGVALVVLTGTDDDALGARAVQAGAQDYLVKGKADEWLLVRAMRYATERHQLQVQRDRWLVAEQAARVAAQAAEKRMTFLADVSAALSDTLHDDRLDEVVAALAVPRFADCCIIERPDTAASSGWLTVKHVDPMKEGVVRALYRSGLPVHDGNLVEGAQAPERLALLQALAPRDRLPLHGRVGSPLRRRRPGHDPRRRR
jgi:hypothetical protein